MPIMLPTIIMATKSSASTTEYSLMVRSTSALVNAIEQSPQEIGLELFAGCLFSKEDRDFVCESSSESKTRKAIRVVNVVTDRTQHNSNVLARFVEVLKKAGHWTNDAVELLTTTPVLEVVIDDVPFDIGHHRVLTYCPDTKGLQSLTSSLADKLRQVSA